MGSGAEKLKQIAIRRHEKVVARDKEIGELIEANYTEKELLDLKHTGRFIAFLERQSQEHHAPVEAIRQTLYKIYPKLRPAKRGPMTLTKKQVADLWECTAAQRDRKLERLAKQRHFSPTYFKSEMLSHYPEISKQPGQTALSSEQQGNVIVWYLRKNLTIDQIIDRLSFQGVKATQNDVSSVLNSFGCLDD